MSTSKSPSMRIGLLFSRQWFAPPPREQRHPSEPHQQRAFSGSPCGCKSVLQRKRFTTVGCHVLIRGVVDKEQASECNERERHGGVEASGKSGRAFVDGWFPKQPCNGPEGQPHRQAPHASTGAGDPHWLCLQAKKAVRDLPAEKFGSRIAKREEHGDDAFGKQHGFSYQYFESDEGFVKRTHVAELLW